MARPRSAASRRWRTWPGGGGLAGHRLQSAQRASRRGGRHAGTRPRRRRGARVPDRDLPRVPGTSRRALALVFDLPASPYILNVLQGVLASATDTRLDLLTRLAPDLEARTQRTAARAWIADQRAAGAVGIVGLTLSEPDALLGAAAEVGMPFVMVDPVDARTSGR